MIRKLFMLVLLGGCASAGATGEAPPIFERATVPLEPAPFDVAWTARDGISFLQGQGRGEGTIVLRPFTRLEVLGVESGGLRVRCAVCSVPVEGLVSESDVVHYAYAPEVAAWGSLPEFALSLRAAAEAERLDLLVPVMIADFTQSLIGPQTPAMALEVWQSENLNTLSQLPGLLDQGLSTRDTVIWSAPPAFMESPNYRGPRAGFRLQPGRGFGQQLRQPDRPDGGCRSRPQ